MFARSLLCSRSLGGSTKLVLCLSSSLPKRTPVSPSSSSSPAFFFKYYTTTTPLHQNGSADHDKPHGKARSTPGQVIVVTSGKGGVGKTTTAASFSYGLALRGLRTCAIDFDIGLRNLDIHFGMERRVVFDFINVINGEASLKQALIKDKSNPNLYMLAASQTRDKTALKMEGVEKILDELRRDFDYIVCDSPAGIESGAHHAMYWSDEAVICTNPEASSVRDSDKMIGIIQSKSKRAMEGRDVKLHLLITRYSPERAEAGGMLPVRDIQELLGTNIKLIGVIPESTHVLESTNLGKPVITREKDKSDASQAYLDMVDRFLGVDKPMNFITPKQKTFFQNLMAKISQ